jgi:glycerol-1-phosphate dehydrogenase [NAD(P)+]
MNIKENIYERHTFKCPACGRTHVMPVGDVAIGQKSAYDLPKFAPKLGKKGVLITDEVIFNAMGARILDSWRSSGLDISEFVFKGRVVANETAVGRVICKTPTDADYLISIGGGTITDVVRYAASRLGKKCVSIPSAMTMDGFFTNMSIIMIDGMQITFYLNYPDLILADTDIIANAPLFMNGAGVGEVVSKISAGLDWYSGKLVKNIYYCDAVADMMGQCISEGSGAVVIEKLKDGDRDAVWNLTDGLYKSAVGMAWYDSSPCGSGAEHQLNHYWVMRQEERGESPAMHGQLVGVGAVVNMALWKKILDLDLENLDIEATLKKAPTRDEWEKGLRAAYGKEEADSLIELQTVKTNNHTFEPEARREELRKIKENAGKLRERFNSYPSSEEIADMLSKVAAPNSPLQIGINKEDFIYALYYAKEARTGRYNALWLAEAVGILDAAAPLLADEFGL